MLSKFFFRGLVLFSIGMTVSFVVPAQPGFWKNLVPHHARLQYGGGIGFFSAGAGYANKNKKLETDLIYGYVPAGKSGVEIHSVTAKFQWIPFKPLQSKHVFLKPLVSGILINHSFGRQYFRFKPANYPYSYYKFPTSLTSAFLLGSQVGTRFPGGKTLKGLSCYYELLAFDRELISFVSNNHTLRLDDILTLGFGIKLDLK